MKAGSTFNNPFCRERTKEIGMMPPKNSRVRGRISKGFLLSSLAYALLRDPLADPDGSRGELFRALAPLARQRRKVAWLPLPKKRLIGVPFYSFG